MRPLTAVLVAALVVGAFFTGQAVESAAQRPAPSPDGGTTATCYLWAENGTAAVTCPEVVYTPSGYVNITVIDCHEYERAIDEPRPCGG